MATINTLKQALLLKIEATTLSHARPLSDAQYGAGFDILLQGSGWITYQDFIIPELRHQMACLLESRSQVAVLEIGPGPKSVFGSLPTHLKQKITRYVAFEPNGLFATRLEHSFGSESKTESPLPWLQTPPDIRRTSFNSTHITDDPEKYDIVLFCHSMYGMKPKKGFVKRAIGMLVDAPRGGLVVVFHRNNLHLDGLVPHQTANFPTGTVSVSDDDDALDCFASFITGLNVENKTANEAAQMNGRAVCRALCRRERSQPGKLLFSSPEVMAVFTQFATTLPDLLAKVPYVQGDRTIKNREARLHRPAVMMRPTSCRHLQYCVQSALKHRWSLTVVGGSHSGHCLWPNVVAIDMAGFNQVHIISDKDSTPLVVAEAGCTTEDIIRKTLSAGWVVPLGARPSVGAGLWLQGGIGHLARLYGLTCDAIVGAVMISVDSGDILCIGCVPNLHQPAGSIRPENEHSLLWAIKGAGTNFGIAISVIFKTYPAPTYFTTNYVVSLENRLQAQLKFREFGKLTATNLDRNLAADAYLYWDGQLRLGMTMFECSTTGGISASRMPKFWNDVFGPRDSHTAKDSIDLFEADMYMFGMHGGHGGSKTSSFKRCLFLKDIGELHIAECLVAAMESRPSPICYLHLLQGGGAISDVAADATAFGCRDWDFACVITGVWPRDLDDTEAARSTIQWVYDIARDLLPFSSGVYSADLGPDPRDLMLATKAFGPNGPRLAYLKGVLDPSNVLAYVCPLPQQPTQQKLIIVVTGESGTGKDYCANFWAPILKMYLRKGATTRVISISDETKKEYAIAVGADLSRLLGDRAYKEQHRPDLTAFFQEQVQQRPGLPLEHFLRVVHAATDIDVLLITGMRDEAPITALSHLVPKRRLLDIQIQASEQVQKTRRGYRQCSGNKSQSKEINDSKPKISTALDYCPSFTFQNDRDGNEAANEFAKRCLVPFLHENLQRLANMVRLVPNFPQPGIDFRHVLGISEQPDGLALCTSLLRTHFIGDWAKVDKIACYGTGGLVFAPPLALLVGVSLWMIREANKLPSPKVSVIKTPSHIASLTSHTLEESRIEMGLDIVSKGASVVVVDDVFATGTTLCSMLQLLNKSGIRNENISVMVVAEFPIHRGRDLLRRHGFGGINIQSLLIFDGA
ncbi:hypothetical protein GQ44DRAFT_723494 [Phaeosphaeriaceae sp. PMI808]|nr:hypothetical protein GQ44DRAFT_723494 [Phaeosphaeriaceae sp. PMI808]